MNICHSNLTEPGLGRVYLFGVNMKKKLKQSLVGAGLLFDLHYKGGEAVVINRAEGKELNRLERRAIKSGKRRGLL